jgi:hypothetical protein
MPGISDLRRIRVHRAKIVRGEMMKEQGCDVWQTVDGKIMVTSVWEGILVPAQEDLEIAARKQMISPLELLRQKLECCPGLSVEILGHAKA